MNFFEEQHRARRRTGLLIALYLLAVIALVAGVFCAVVGGAIVAAAGEDAPFTAAEVLALAPEIFVGSTIATLLLILGGTLWEMVRLRRGGGAAVAEMLGGRRVERDTGDALERRLINVVDEMAIAAGIPVPEAYVLDDELGINAFAAGHTLSNAVVAITRGTLENLDRAELQGVVAHEFSHILNGDMGLNIRMSGVLHGILLVAVLGRGILRGTSRAGRSRRKGNGGAAIFGLGLIAAGYAGVLAARLIQAAVSRQREFLADAAAVQFTRYPEGIAGALVKIGWAKERGHLQSAQAMRASHFFFADGLSRWLSAFATHPPVEARIGRILPNADVAALLPQAWQREAIDDETRDAADLKAPSLAGPGGGAGGGGGGGGAAPLRPDAVTAAVGTVDGSAVAEAQAVLFALPAAVTDALATPQGARDVVLGLFAADGPHAAALAALPAHGRLDVVQMAVAPLRRLPDDERRALPGRVSEMALASAGDQAFGLAVSSLLARALAPPGEDAATAPGAKDARILARTVFAVLARIGAADHAAAEDAFRDALATADDPAPDAALPDAAPEAFDGALARLALLPPRRRKAVVAGCAAAVRHDGVVTDVEAEVLRAVCEALDAPLPPGFQNAAPDSAPAPDSSLAAGPGERKA